ncbi:hypothetical protein [Cellulomonas sp. ES6]|uniref:arsenate reductase/protein-tyrosine-phosphatase family protein n=1 Tax=Cellulomonas sp. ES6 TaxID=3039384 RepID=UPI0024B7D3B3|nr:hypothetical protein [Cellulomonas sp. ES6]WHP19261.1 hypothetical protein P9841_09300 [Cellulomonas sp. ES6]
MTGAAEQALVLGDPDALQILALLMTDPRGGAAARDLIGPGMAAPRVKARLAELAGAGLVEAHSAGPDPLYAPTAAALMRFGSVVEPHAAVGPATRQVHAAVLDRVSVQLAGSFRGVFGEQTVRRYVQDSYDLLAGRARVAQHLPVLAARFAADRLAALAAGEGPRSRRQPEVLFVCVRNAARSQIAAAALRHHAGTSVGVRTAGSAPAARIDPVVSDAITRRGWPLALEFPKPLTDEVVRAADYVVSLGCGDACPVYPGRHYLDWEVSDPVGRDVDIESVVEVIDGHVLALIDRMERPTS